MSGTKKEYTLLAKTMSILMPICLILAGVGGFRYYKSKEMKIKRQPPKKQAVMVETVEMQPGTYQSTVHAMGTVKPDQQIVIKSKVAGEVVSISSDFVLGGLMKKGNILLEIEDLDYQIEVKKAASELEKAVSDFEIELGSQKIAKEELNLIKQAGLGEIKETDLALRKPQLIQAKADVDRARADLESAKLNLSRTKVVLPFNALILEKNVSIGSLVTAQDTLATLVDVDLFQVEAQVPPDKLDAIKTGEVSGSKVVVHSRFSNQEWPGRVARFTGRVAPNSRMAGVIILVDDPLGLNRKERGGPLLLDDHVEVKIMSRMLENVFSLPRTYLRDNDTVWIYNNGRLEIRQVDFAWKEDGVVFVRSGIRAGDRLIVSDLPAPIEGMALQTTSGSRS